MAWQYALGLIIGGGIIGGLAIVAGRMIRAGTYIGLLGLAAAVMFTGELVADVHRLIGQIAAHGSAFPTEHEAAWWCLAGVVVGTGVTIAVIRGDEGEPSGARATTPRFLALVGLVLSLAATVPSRFGGFGDSTGDALVLWAGTGVVVGLAAIAFGIRANQPESPSYVAFTTTIGAALAGLLVALVDSPSRLTPLLLGAAVVPLLVGGVFAISGLLRPLAVGSGREVTVLTSAGVGLLVVNQLVVVALVGSVIFLPTFGSIGIESYVPLSQLTAG